MGGKLLQMILSILSHESSHPETKSSSFDFFTRIVGAKDFEMEKEKR